MPPPVSATFAASHDDHAVASAVCGVTGRSTDGAIEGGKSAEAALLDLNAIGIAAADAAVTSLPVYPVVDFEVGSVHAPSTHRMLVTLAAWELEQAGKTVAKRTQVPVRPPPPP